MKYIYNIAIAMLLLISSQQIYSQSIIGKWTSSDVIRDIPKEEYTLSRFKENNRGEYGNNIEFHQDGTFTSWYSAPCGVDCFPSSKGTYKYIDGNYIQLKVTQVEQYGFCDEFKKKGKWKLGKYYIHYDKSGIIKLVKSSNNLEEDKANAKHSIMMYTCVNYYNRFNRKYINIAPENTNQLDKIVYEYIKIPTYKIVKQGNNGAYNIYLVKNLSKDDDYWVIGIYKNDVYYYNYNELAQIYLQ